MKTKSFTSKEIGEWIATFHKYNTKEEYRNNLHAVRCIFDAHFDREFWDEVVAFAKEEINK